ncbi:gamma-glutamylcysteine synthetase [Streptococcus pneumoniae]|nr:gamma-glutamylcysteine synthetase [Streptococcus pneumoniae]
MCFVVYCFHKNSITLFTVTEQVYSFYDDEFLKALLYDKINVRVLLSKISNQSQHYTDLIREIVPNSEVIQVEETHAKIVLAEPNFVYLGSQNIDQSDWF